MRFYMIAAATAALLAMPFSATAATVAPATDISSQTIRVDPGGVRIGDGHRRSESRDRRERRSDRRCRTETRTVERRGRMVTTRTKVCD